MTVTGLFECTHVAFERGRGWRCNAIALIVDGRELVCPIRSDVHGLRTLHQYTGKQGEPCTLHLDGGEVIGLEW